MISQPITKDQPADQNHLKNNLEPSKSAGLQPARLVDRGVLTEPETTVDAPPANPTGTNTRAPDGASKSPGIAETIPIEAKLEPAGVANAAGDDAVMPK